MYKYVVVGNGTYEEYEGCWIFQTFKKAFSFMAEMYNKEYEIWENEGCEIYATVERKLDNSDYELYVDDEDDGSLYVDALFYTIHDKPSENGVYHVGHRWEIYTATEM